MPQPRNSDEDTVRALENLSHPARPTSTGEHASPAKAPPSKTPGRATYPPTTARSSPPCHPVPEPPKQPQARTPDPEEPLTIPLAPPGPPPEPLIPAIPAARGGPQSLPETPIYRCLGCGYPLAGEDLRCAECGRSYDADTLAAWFSGDERARFDHVLWLATASLFLRLLLIPQLMWVAKLGGAAVAMWACYVAMRNKPEGPGRFYGLAGITAGGLMTLSFAWSANPLPYYTLDMLAGCVLLLAMLHDASGDGVAGHSASRALAPVLLFLTPLFALACYLADWATGAALAGRSALFDAFPPFTTGAPYLAAAGIWIFVWRSLTGIRKLLFGERDDGTR